MNIKPIISLSHALFHLTLALISTSATAQIGAVTKLNGNLSTTDVSNWQISSDGKYALYTADEGIPSEQDLYSVSLLTGKKIKLSSSTLLTSVRDYQISNDSQYVVYEHQESLNFEFRSKLRIVKIDGGQTIDIALPATSSSSGIKSFAISPDSATIIFIIDNRADEFQSLYSVPMTGGNSTLIQTGKDFGSASAVLFANDSAKLVYRAADVTFDMGTFVPADFDLFSVSIDGSGLTRITHTSNTRGQATGAFQLSPNQQKVVFIVQDPTSGDRALFSSNLDGTINNQLEQPSPRKVQSFTISPDNNTVVYSAMLNDNSVNLYSAPINTGNIITLHSAIIAGEQVREFELSDDGSDLFYRTLVNFRGRELGALYRYRFGASSPQTLLTPVRVFVSDFEIVDTNTVLASYGPDFDQTKLYSININTSVSTQISASDDIENYSLSPNKDKVFLVEKANGESSNALFRIMLDDSNRTKLSAPHQSTMGEYNFEANSTETFLLYQTDQDTPNLRELYAVQLEELPNDSLCIPIKTQNGAIAIVCL